MEVAGAVVKAKSEIQLSTFLGEECRAIVNRMLTFLPATPADAAQIRSLAERIWSESYAGIVSAEQMAYMIEWMYSEETITRELSEGVSWEVARLHSEAVGYLSVTFGVDAVAKLNKLYLLPAHQGRGLGQEMLARVFALAAARGVSEIRLQVNRANLRAQLAYERFGFRRIEEAVFSIGSGFVMDDYIMARSVAS